VVYLFPFFSVHAATSDASFNSSMQILDNDPNVLKGPIWHTSPLNKRLQRMETARLWGSHVLRWTAVVNPDGSRTIVIMTRLPDDFLADDPDEFDIFIQRGADFISADSVLSNAFAFSRHSNIGMFGLFFCKWGGITKEWVWTGDRWE
jgi:hypothetical protein